jgi:phage N-6-adenine-methyltransferase
MKQEDAEEFTQSLGQIVGGSWRQIALAKRLGVPEALGYSSVEDWVRDRIGGYIRLTVEERREAVQELIADGHTKNTEIADILGVDESTVREDKKSGNPEASQQKQAKEATSEVANSGNPETPDPRGHHLARNSGNNEWYTPAEDVERARKVLGKIELDPASSAIAQETVKAERYYTKEQDGLAQEWSGRVWMNPPYAKGDIEPFVAKLVAEHLAGNVKAAIMLTNNSADTEWFHKAASHASAICLTRGRIKFEDPNSDRAAPLQGQAFFYFGPNVKKFVSLYAPAGVVLLPYRKD